MKMPGLFNAKQNANVTGDVIERVFGGFRGWLTRNSFPVPSTGEWRILLFLKLEKAWQEDLEEQKQNIVAQFAQYPMIYSDLMKLLAKDPKKEAQIMKAIKDADLLHLAANGTQKESANPKLHLVSKESKETADVKA